MGLLAKKFGKAPTKEQQANAKRIPVMQYMLHGTYLMSIDIDDDSTIEYIPLTLGEQLDCGSLYETDTEKYAARAIAKAFKYKFNKGLEQPEEYLLDADKSFMWNANQFINSLTKETRASLLLQIATQEGLLLSTVMKWFSEEAEDYMESGFKGKSRDPTNLDDFLRAYYPFRESPYRFEDISNMTPVQYFVWVGTVNEANVRSNNDQTAHSNKATTSTKKGPGYVGG